MKSKAENIMEMALDSIFRGVTDHRFVARQAILSARIARKSEELINSPEVKCEKIKE